MLSEMLDKGIPIDGIALPFHVDSAEDYKISYNDIAKTIKRFGALGLKVMITELKVKCENCPSDAEMSQKQALMYANAM